MPPGTPPPPPGAGPELLDSGAGRWAPPAAGPARPGRGRRKGLLVGGGVVGLVAAAGGAFAVYQLAFATGPQPAEALPDSTIGYVSVDLDPSGKQKLEALETLKKFPAFDDNVDVETDDDLRERLFEYVQDEGACPDVDFGDDIEPWLGDRFGFAAVDVGDDVAPDSSGIAPVGVVQVKDADAAEAGLAKLKECADPADAVAGATGSSYGSSDGFDTSAGEVETTPPDDEGDDSDSGLGWSIQGDWVVIAESTEIAEAVTDAAQDAPLSDDDDFEKWTDAAGDPGIVSAYLAPEAAAFLTDAVGSLSMGSSMTCSGSSSPVSPDDPYAEDPYAEDPYYEESCTEEFDDTTDEAAQALQDSLEDFDGAAMAIRFEDGGLELESAASADLVGLGDLYRSDRGDDVVSDLPDDTAIAVGIGFEQGWFTALTDYLGSVGGGIFDLEEGLQEIEEQTGLQLPEDAETLAGESAAIAIGGDFDPEAFAQDEPPSDQPVGLKVQGDPDAITSIIDRLLEDTVIGDEVKDVFAYQTDDDHVVAGFSDDWSQQLLDGGDLGDSDTYQDVVRESGDAAAVLYVDFDKGGWLERAVQTAGAPQEVLDNLDPLDALGVSVWTDDDVSHSVVRVTTD